MKQVFEWIVGQGGEIAILSDANTVYITTILKHLGMDHMVSQIITNRGFFEESGRLRVERFWKESQGPHGCPNGCAPNLCKGPFAPLFFHPGLHLSPNRTGTQTTDDFEIV